MSYPRILLLLPISAFLATVSHGSASNGLEEKLEFTVEEGVSAGTVVGRVPKRDGYTYRLNERNRFFAFNSSNGELRTLDDAGAPLLDREALERYGYKHGEVDFVILGTATSSAVTPPTYFVAVTVRITDINDNAPIFPFSFQNVSLPESARVGTRLILASAADADEGDNGSIKDYQLIGGDDEDAFHLGRGTTAGDEAPEAVFLELQKPLDRETRALYILNVSATDGGKPALTGYLTVFVNVLDSNDNQPIFERQQYSVSVSENLPAGSSILLVSAMDKDSGENARISYSIGNDAENQFRINPETGVVSSNTAPLKCPELKPTNSSNATRLCTFTVEAIDHGVPVQRGRTFVNVELFDVNDHAPEIAFRYYSAAGSGNGVELAAIVDETKPIGTVVAVVTVTDPDHGDNGKTTVNIVKGNELGHFRLESNDLFSVVRTNATLKRASIDKYSLSIMAKDKGNPPKFSMRTMFIYVNDANDQPPTFDQSIYAAQVPENSPFGTYVLAIRADAGNGRRADDGCRVDVWYDFVNDTNSSGNPTAFFHLDHKSGLVAVKGRLDYDERSVSGRNFTFTVSAKDACRPSLRSSTAMVKIDISDTNDQAPSFSKTLYNVDVHENATVGSVILKLEAFDGDSGDNGRIKYAFADATNQSDLATFSLHPTTGRLALSTSLDREIKDSYKLTVIATDNGSPPLKAFSTVRIRVHDVNDNAPKFRTSEYYVNLHPFDPAGTTLAKVVADDPDEGVSGEVTYFFLEQPPISAISLAPNTGVLYLKSRMAWSRPQNRFDLVLSAVDGGGYRAANNATVHVFVSDLSGDGNSNSSLPRFTKESYVFRVREDAGTGAADGAAKSVGTVSATDADAPVAASSSIHYKIIDGDYANLFGIGPYSGEIRATRNLDREEGDEYVLTVAALGKLGVSTVEVRMEIEDVNDNVPRFLTNDTKLVLQRGQPAGFQFHVVKAIDLDSGVNGLVRYGLKGDAETLKHFGIDDSSGTLFLKTPAYLLRRSAYTVAVTATDSGSPALSATSTLHVAITDDNATSAGWFPRTAYEYSVWENTAVNSRLIKLNLTKPCNQENNGDCVFYSEDETSDDAFGLFPDGWLYVKNELDFEKRSSFHLNVIARQKIPGKSDQQGAMETKSVTSVSLHLVDQNDNAPKCSNGTFVLHLPEHAPPLAYVGTVTAEDADNGLNGFVKYQLLPDSENLHANFHIGASSGIITALRTFDRENLLKTRNSVVLPLIFEAQDFGKEPKRVQCKIEIEITDVNDHAPQFALDVYAVSVPENQEVGSEILRLTATDEDEGDNGAVEFLILEGDDSDNRFWLNASTGQLLLAHGLDREQKNSYVLKLMARDFGWPNRLNSTAYATVFVSDVNDNAPVFQHHQTTVGLSESAPVGTIVIHLLATDADLGAAGTVRYSITNGNAGQVFEIDPVTGALILAKSLDFETQRNYTLSIWAADQGTPSLMNATELFINIEDENDNAPVITTPILVAQVPENAPIGTRVFVVTASDPDTGLNGTVRFALIDQKPTKAFEIEPETGVIFLSGHPDSESTDVYNILVEARDSCEQNSLQLSTRRLITVLLTDGDSSISSPFRGPKAIVLRPDYVSNLRPGSKIADMGLGAAGNSFSYSLAAGDTDTLEISSSGSLISRRQLDGTKALYKLTVQAISKVNSTTANSGRHFSEYTVIVEPQQSSLRFEKASYQFQMPSNAPNGTEIGRLTLQSSGDSTRIEYYVTKSSLLPASNATAAEMEDLTVDIDRHTGALFTTGVLRRKRFRKRPLDTVLVEVVAVNAESKSPSSAKCEVVIQLQPSSDTATKFSENFYQFQIGEDAAIGTAVGQVKMFAVGGINATRTPSSRFSITNRTSVPFEIHPDTGTIAVSQLLDREAIASYDFEIRADDGASSPKLASVHIDLLDVNDNDPNFGAADAGQLAFNFRVVEGAQRNTFVGKVTATDKDAGGNGEIEYALQSPELAAVFTIDPQTGVIRVNRVIDREEYPVFFLDIQASDRGNPPRKTVTTVLIRVLDVNDNQPVMERSFYEVSVNENASIGTALLQLTAWDYDADTNFSYAIVSGNVWGQFAINYNGILVVAAPLDRETRAVYHLVVTVYDQPPDVPVRHSISAQVTVNILDVNDNAPRFISPDWIAVAQTTPPGTVLTTVKAVDLDEGAAGSVSYLLDPNSAGIFSLDPLSGELRLTAPLPKSHSAVAYNLSIWAYDRGEPRLGGKWQLTVHILADMDGFSPAFEQKQLEISVSEDTPVGKSLLQLALAQEAGTDPAVRFWLLDGQRDIVDFDVAPDTGILSIARPLDYERKTAYNLTVAVSNLKLVRPTDLATVLIQVKDVNDNPPTFLQSPVYFDIVEGQWTSQPASVGLVTAVDPDSGPGGKLSYSIIQGNTSVFSIDSLNGELKMQGVVDREAITSYTLTVEAADSGSPRRTSRTQVIITVLDMNDNEPIFDKPSYVGSVIENQAAGVLVLQVSATDADEGVNGLINYKLESMDKLPFSIDESTGEIRTKASLDREFRDHYDFVVIASDTAIMEPRSSSVRVRVKVEDENDNAPSFIDTSQDIYISTATTIGGFVYVVGAEDADEGENARLRYFLGGRDAKYFDIAPDTGVIQCKASASTLSAGDFSVDVFVGDSGQKHNLNASTSLRFFPRAATDFPDLSQTRTRNFSVLENQTNVDITNVFGRSPKQPPLNRITYSIASGNFGGAFAINALTGRLSTTATLDYEFRHSYELYIAVTDNDNPPLTSFIRINVIVEDCNDNAPVFEETSYTAAVLEEEPPPISVIQVKATDADSGANGRIRYSIKNDPLGMQDLFEINVETGAIVTKAALDREKSSRYKLMVEAHDGGRPSLNSAALVVVDVTDVNDNAPKFTRLFAASVREDAVVGAFVTQVTSSDADSLPENTNNTYHLSANPGDKFIIDPRTGNVSVKGPLDRESVPEYQLKVVAVDGAWRVETSLTVTVLDVNDNAPKFSRGHYMFNISELQPALTLVGKVQAVDIDEKGPNSKILYRLAEKTSLFLVDSQTGELRTSKVLRHRFGDSDTHELAVIAEDGGRPIMWSMAQVTVKVVAKRTGSVFSRKAMMIAMPVTMEKGARIWRPAVTDEDIIFSLEDESSDVAIDPASGWLFTTKPLSVAVGTQYKLTILAQDAASTATLDPLDVTLTATDVNKNAPEFSSPTYAVNIAENIKPGSAIFTVSARDYDQGLNGKVAYTCARNNSSNNNDCDLFSVDEETGVIVLIKELDFETARTHKILVSATDGGYEPKRSFATLVVNVQDVNDNPPSFAQAKNGHLTARVQENAAKGASVIHPLCTDPDSPPYNSVEYSIENGTDSRFAVNASSGLITVIGDIDFETRSIYVLAVKCKNPDSTSMVDTATLTIYVDGVNEFMPKFEKANYVFEADWGSADGAVVGVVKATDDDAGDDGIVFYSIKAGDGNALAVNELTGEITIRKRSGENSSSITILAQNRRAASPSEIAQARVTVLFSQKGTTHPVFASKTIYAEIHENAAVGTVVTTVNATGHRVFYELASGNAGDMFQVDSSTGAIRVNGKLDREAMDSYILTVKAYGATNTSIPSTATVTVAILDVNDNVPYLTESASIGYVLENEPNDTAIMTLLPSDDDLPPNRGPFNFALLDSKWAGFFELDPTSGVLKSKASFDREVSSRYTIPVKISDAGQPSLWGISNVTVIIEDINDQPSGTRPVHVKVLSFQAVIPSKVDLGAVYPDDQDSVGEYSCKPRFGNSTATKLQVEQNCIITNDGQVSAPSQHKLALTGTDGIHDWVDYEAVITFEQGSADWVENAVLLDLRADPGKLAKSFLAWLHEALKDSHSGAGQLTARIVHASPRTSIFDQSMELAVVLLDETGAPIPFPKAVQMLRTALKDTPNPSASDFEISSVYSGFCSTTSSNSTSRCQNGGQCVEVANVDHNIYHFITEGSLTLSFPQMTRSYKCNCPSDFSGLHCESVIDQCVNHPCSNGATCVYQKELAKIQCICPPGFTGPNCEEDIDECKTTANGEAPCLNNGWCENTKGSYRCLCLVGYGGSRCENSTSYCASEPCLNGGKCAAKADGYTCTCEFGYTGSQCQFGSMGFEDASYLELKTDSVMKSGNGSSSLEFEFATIHANALLVYSSKQGANNGYYLAVEISQGNVRLVGTLPGTGGAINAIIGSKKPINDGRWYKLSLTHGGTKLGVLLGECSSVKCVPCKDNDASCQTIVEVGARNPFPSESIFIGSVHDVSDILPNAADLSAPGFVGCIRNLKVNGLGIDKLRVSGQESTLNYCPRTSQPPCASSRANSSCGEGEQCRDGWSRPVCSCQGGFSSSNCRIAEETASFNGEGYLSYKLTESYRRRLLFAHETPESKMASPDDTYRFKRLAAGHYPKQWLILEFRTTEMDSLLFFATSSGEEFSLIDIVNGSVRYMSRSKDSKPMQITLSDGPFVSDGDWHLVSLALQPSGNEVEFRIDNFGKDARSSVRLHSVVSANLTAMSVGGAGDPVKIGGSALKGFNGCLRKFIVNGVLQPLIHGDTTFFNAQPVGEVKAGCDVEFGCSSPPCSNTPINDSRDGARFNAGVVAVLVFFACMIISTVIAFFIVRRLKNRKCGKKTGSSASSSERAAFANLGTTVANISTISDIVRLRQHSDCANLNGSIKDSGIVLGVSRQTLDGSQISLNNPLDAHRTATSSTLSASTYLNNYLQDQNPNHGNRRGQNLGMENEAFAASRRESKGFGSNPFVERYDLEDASSMAPSDVDVAKHYRDYRQSGLGMFGGEGPQRKLPSKFIAPPPPFADSTIPSLFGSHYASAQSLAARNRKSPGLRATPTSVLAMMPESESSDEIMMQRNLRAVQGLGDTPVSASSKGRPESNRSIRSRQRRQALSGDRASARLRKSQRGSTKSRSRRRREHQDGESDRSSEDTSSSSDATPAARTSSLKASRRSASGNKSTAPRILSRGAQGQDFPHQHSSTNEEYSDTVSAALHSEFDLDQVRKPRRFLQQPEDTETESDINAVHARQRTSFCLDQFIPGPRTLFLMSEDDTTTDIEGDAKNRGSPKQEVGRNNRSPSAPPLSEMSTARPAKDGLEAYV